MIFNLPLTYKSLITISNMDTSISYRSFKDREMRMGDSRMSKPIQHIIFSHQVIITNQIVETSIIQSPIWIKRNKFLNIWC